MACGWYNCRSSPVDSRLPINSDTGSVLSDSNAWNDYWVGSRSGAAFNAEGADHPVLDHFWRQALGEVTGTQRLIDLASGRGALLGYLPEEASPDICCVDRSLAALASQRNLRPGILPVVADVADIPFADQGFDLVISQFGVEYGGAEAIDRVYRLIAPGGRVILVLHRQNSIIDLECRNNLEALHKLREIEFLPLARSMFTAGYAVLKGQAAREHALAHGRALLEPFRRLGELLGEHGEAAAGGTLLTLYQETARIQQRIQHHLEEEVIGWLETMEREIVQYEARMQSMTAAALSQESLMERVAKAVEAGITLEPAMEMNAQPDQALAWVLDGTRT